MFLLTFINCGGEGIPIAIGKERGKHGVGKYCTVRSYNGTVRLYNGIARLYNGTARSYNGIVRLYNGIVRLYNGTVRLYNGIVRLYNGIVRLYNAIVQKSGAVCIRLRVVMGLGYRVRRAVLWVYQHLTGSAGAVGFEA